MKKLLHKIYQLVPMLVLLSIVFFGGGQSSPVFAEPESVQEDPIEELPYEENSILALNYNRVREKNFPTMLIDFMSNSKELQIYSVYDDEFEDQMKWLKSQGANFLTLDQAIECIETGNVPEKAVWISFDDMDQTIYDNAQPILEKYDIPATGFVITGQVGNQNFNSISLMDLESLVELDESGLWSFGLHTDDLHYLDEHNNSALLAASDQTVKKDTKKSQDYLDKYLENCRTDAIAYPYGQMNDQTQVSLAEQGVRYGFTLEEKAIHNPINDFYIPRVLVSQESFERLVKSWQGFQ